MEWQTKTIRIGDIKDLLEQGYEVEVTSPDGWVPVSDFVDKGMWEGYWVHTDNGYKVLCNENHLFKTVSGWMTASQIHAVQELFAHNLSVYTDRGL